MPEAVIKEDIERRYPKFVAAFRAWLAGDEEHGMAETDHAQVPAWHTEYAPSTASRVCPYCGYMLARGVSRDGGFCHRGIGPAWRFYCERCERWWSREGKPIAEPEPAKVKDE